MWAEPQRNRTTAACRTGSETSGVLTWGTFMGVPGVASRLLPLGSASALEVRSWNSREVQSPQRAGVSPQHLLQVTPHLLL